MTLDRLLQKHENNRSPARVIAEKVVAELREKEPVEYDAWASQLVTAAVAEMVSRRRRGVRSAFRNHERRRLLNEAIDTGDFSIFRLPYTIDAEGNQAELEHMTPEHCDFARRRHESQAKVELMDAAFLKAVAAKTRRLQKNTVGEAFTEEQLQKLRDNLLERKGRAS